MIAISLQSGSNGNCIYVETNEVKLLFDAGISCRKAARRLQAHGRDIRDVDALIISHDHADHISCAGVYHRKYGMPIYITPKTLNKAEKENRLGALECVNYFLAGGEIHFGDASIRTIPTPHDAADGAVFVIACGSRKLGILTDLGHVFGELFTVISSLDAVFIESNYDPDMLENGRYPAFLKKRIKGPEGHISNAESAELLRAGGKLKWACLAHLSENNNDPQVALNKHFEVLGQRLPLYIAGRYGPSVLLTV